MIPGDENFNTTIGPGEQEEQQQMTLSSFSKLQVESDAALDLTGSASSSAGKQYMIVGAVLVLSAGALWFMRGQGVGVDIASGEEVKIEYEVDEKAIVEEEERQRELMQDLALTDNPNQVPVDELQKNPFEMALLTQDEDEPETAKVEEPVRRGPTAEELRAQELKRAYDNLELNTVLRGRVSLARIGGKTYRVGDVVEKEFLLLSIEDRSVTLGADGKTFTLELDAK